MTAREDDEDREDHEGREDVPHFAFDGFARPSQAATPPDLSAAKPRNRLKTSKFFAVFVVFVVFV